MPVTDRRLLVIVPTRGRPENVLRLEQARMETMATRSHFLYVVDEDDPEVGRYLHIGVDDLAIVHRRRLGPTLNMISADRAPGFDYVGFMGDDHLPRTPEWDRMIVNALDWGGPRIVYGNDLLQGANLPTAVFMPSRVVKALGFMCPPDQVHLYLDNFWLELGKAVDCLTYLPGVVIEHLHPAAGKAEWDHRYQEVNSGEVDRADHQAWVEFQTDGRFRDAVERVRKEYGS